MQTNVSTNYCLKMKLVLTFQDYLQMLFSVLAYGVVCSGILVLLLGIAFFSFDSYIKPKLTKFGVKFIMNHIGVLDNDNVEDKGKYLLIRYSYSGCQYASIVPKKNKSPRGRKVYALQSDDQRIDITNIRGASYNFTANDLGVCSIIVTQNKLGEEIDIKTYTADDPIIVV